MTQVRQEWSFGGPRVVVFIPWLFARWARKASPVFRPQAAPQRRGIFLSQVSLESEHSAAVVAPARPSPKPAGSGRALALPQVSVRVIVAAGVILLAHLPLVWLHLWGLWENPQHGYGLLVPVGVFILVQQRLSTIGQLHPGGPIGLCVGICLALFCDVLAIAFFDPGMGVYGLSYLLLGVAYALGGRKLFWPMLAIWFFAMSMVPRSAEAEARGIAGLQKLTASWSSQMLDQFRVIHLLIGNTIELPGRQLFVEEACSGVQSLLACWSGTLFFVLWTRRGIFRSILLLAFSMFWVLAANALRIFLVTVAADRNIDLATGTPHWLLGMLVFAFTMGMVLSTDRLLEFFTLHDPKYWWNSGKPNRGPAVFPALRHTYLDSWLTILVTVVFAVLVVWQVYLLAPVGASTQTVDMSHAPAAFEKLSAETMPAVWGGTRPQTEFKHTIEQAFHAVHSRYWAYGKGSDRIWASVDFPFAKWHDITVCYRGLGWDVNTPTFHPPRGAGDLPFMDCEMNQMPLGYGYLVFVMFDPQGKPFIPSSLSLDSRLHLQLTDRVKNMKQNWQHAGAQLAGGPSANYIQAQVFLTSGMPITNPERDEARALMLTLCKRLLEQIERAAEENAQSPAAATN